MDEDDKIHAHLVSVWRESKAFFSVGGKEGMLFLTDNQLVFVILSDILVFLNILQVLF